MNDKFYSNKEFTDIKNRINAEILRRGGFKWADPLSTPKIGTDRTPPLSLPDTDPVRIPVDDRTYTINSSSEGSIEPTKNIHYPAHGENPAGQLPTESGSEPNTSAALFTVGEIKNFLVGLSKINDINLFYGRDEKVGTAFRDPNGIEELLELAEADHLHQVGAGARKYDPVNGQFITFPETDGINGRYSYIPSGEYEGEELLNPEGLDEHQFFDDYGAQPGDGNYHPVNPATSPVVTRTFTDTNDDRSLGTTVTTTLGGVGSMDPNPRNPKKFDMYKINSTYGDQYPLFQGTSTTCNNVCTGLCNVSCDEVCSESCTSTCTMRCGNACTSSCGNTCSGCASYCYTSCKTKCENSTGYSCVSSGVQAMSLEYGEDGIPQPVVSNYRCTGCSYSCQFYPNKKTTCWDSGCMGKCYTTCLSGCLSSCTGSCFGNDKEDSADYKDGKGQGCSSFCTVNCVGSCDGTCEGVCTTTCFSSCSDECSNTCTNECSNTCDIDCGVDCSANCSDNCEATSCTAKCSDACSSECSSCANTCGFECGACTTECSSSCEETCTFLCTETCANSCEENCVHSCTDVCGGCSNLCFSCVGQCIGICAYRCENGCSSCVGTCTMWCDYTCSQECFANCYNSCMFSCSSSCATRVGSDTTNTSGPLRPPTSPEYQPQHPSNRIEEQDSFNI